MPLHPYPHNVDLTKQSVEIPGSRQPGYSGIWKSGIWERDEIYKGEPETLFDLFEQSVARHPNQALFVRREVTGHNADGTPIYGTNLVPTTYAMVQTRRTAIGSALLALERSGRLRKADEPATEPPEITQPGVPSFGAENRLKNGARRGWGVGVWSKNSEEWQVIDLACQAYGLVGVSLYETLGPDVAKYITNHCPLSIIFATANHLPALIKIAPQCPKLRVIVSIDTLPRAERNVLSQWAESVGLELLIFDELEAFGKQPDVQCAPGPVGGVPEEHALDRDRIFTISYTSGTTGDPKGAVLTNYNMTTATISNAFGSSKATVGTEWMFLSFLPLAHMSYGRRDMSDEADLQRFLELLCIYGDGTIGLTTGDPLRLLEDAQIIRPHTMAGVPRVWNRIYAAVTAQMAAGGLKGALVSRAVNTKLENWRKTGSVRHAVYDALVFRKIRALLGGRLEFVTSGAAPLSPEVHEMLKIAFCCDAIQGCGMTESMGTTSRGIPWDIDAVGTCGAMQPCNDVRLMDVPEMSYLSTDKPNPRGEICIRGTNVFAGYLHDPENTKKTIDEEGWLHTGDVGEIDSCGRLKIIDRIKNVVKLSQGEYVALEKLEGMYALEPTFASLLVHGDSSRASLVAYGVLDPERAVVLVRRVLGEKVTAADISALEAAVQRPEVKRAVLKSLAKIHKENRLNGIERIQGLHLTMMPFPDDILTPTLKVKRHAAAKKFKAEIDAAYASAESLSRESKL